MGRLRWVSTEFVTRRRLRDENRDCDDRGDDGGLNKIKCRRRKLLSELSSRWWTTKMMMWPESLSSAGKCVGGGFRVTGGATYSSVASLQLMGFIEDDLLSKSTSSCIIDVQLLLDWSLQRQAADGGFQGRPNKSSDTCYAFWVGGVLRILGANTFIDERTLPEFLLTCQSQYGGFSKFSGQLPDLYHSY